VPLETKKLQKVLEIVPLICLPIDEC